MLGPVGMVDDRDRKDAVAVNYEGAVFVRVPDRNRPEQSPIARSDANQTVGVQARSRAHRSSPNRAAIEHSA